MAFWKKAKQAAIVDRLVEEKLYEQVFHEVKSGKWRDGLWAKAFQKSQGDEKKARALYYQYRIQSLKDEAEITIMHAEQIDKNCEDITEISTRKEDQRESFCIKCGGINFEYDHYFAEYNCIDCGWSTKEKKLNVINENCDTETKNKNLKDYSDRKYKKLKNDLSKELSGIENDFSQNLEKFSHDLGKKGK